LSMRSSQAKKISTFAKCGMKGHQNLGALASRESRANMFAVFAPRNISDDLKMFKASS
jgi:hypothetical protein